MKRVLSLLLTLCLILSLFGCSPKASNPSPTAEPLAVETAAAAEAAPTPELTVKATPTQNIVILYTNDVHCGIEDGVGYAGVALLKNAFASTGNSVLLVDCGDALQGDSVGTLSKGEYIIDIMNELGYDFAIPGNHEFDYGMEQFLANAEKASFPYLCCNFADAEGNPVFDAYAIKEIGGVKIGFVGVATPKTLSTSVPTNFMDAEGNPTYSFCQDETGEKLYTCVQQAVDAVKAAGADYVIALTHLGIDAECSPWTSSELITHTAGIDAVLDGHSHSVIPGETVKNAEGKNVILTSTGTKLANVGVLTLNTAGHLSTALVENSESKECISEIKEQYADLLDQVVAHTDVDLCITDPATGEFMNRQNETNLGDLCADAYRAISGADIAIVNGGAIRADISAGDITYGDVLSVSPYGNKLSVVEATGAEILDALELSVSRLPGASGGFLHVSGISFTVDLSVESTVKRDTRNMFESVEGARRVKDVTVGGEPLDPDKIYTLASHNYLLFQWGDGYTMFSDNTVVLDEVMLDNQVLMEYMAKVLNGIVGAEYANPYGAGRITIING